MTAVLQPLRQRWQALAPRERRLVAAAAAIVVLALLWWLAVAPALATATRAPARLQQLDTQLQQMERLAAQARQLQARPVVRRDEALRTLDASLQRHLRDRAQTRVAGDQVTVVLTAAPPDALAAWLAQVRANARVVVQQAQLSRGATGWDGSIVLQLPPA